MPSKSKRFTVRITDESDDRRDDLINKVLKKTNHFCVREVGDKTEKPHYHSLHFSGKTTIHERLIKLGWTGNANHAFRPFEDDSDESYLRAIAYLCKGRCQGELPEVVSNTMEITEELILEYHNLWYTKYRGREKKLDQPQKVEDQRKRDKFNFMIKYIKTKGVNETSGAQEYIDAIYDYFEDHGTGFEPNDFQINCYVKSFQRHLIFSSGDKQAWQSFKRQRAREIIGPSFVHPSELFSKVKIRNGNSKTSELCTPPEEEDIS